MVNPRGFLDIQIGTQPAGRITIELFPEHAPKACENFLTLCRGNRPPIELPTTPLRTVELTYRGSHFHRVIDSFMIQGGDITAGNGTGGMCALDSPRAPQLPSENDPDRKPLNPAVAKTFEDENLGWRPIDAAGLVCMANRGPNTNTSQFFITLEECDFLTEKHTLFGQVVAGLDVVTRVGHVEVDANDRPLEDVIIAQCGEVEFKGKGNQADARSALEREGARERSRSRSRDRDRSTQRRGGAKDRRNRSPRPVEDGGEAGVAGGPEDSNQPTDASAPPSRGRSRTPVPTDPRSPKPTRSPEERRRRERRSRSRSHTPRRSRHRRSRSPRHRRSPRGYRDRSRSHSRSDRYRRNRHKHSSERRGGDRDSYVRDDPDEDERILREEREREGRRWDDVPAPEPEVKYKGRGTMRYRERKRWGANEYGRLD